jgi:hypothetical protein
MESGATWADYAYPANEKIAIDFLPNGDTNIKPKFPQKLYQPHFKIDLNQP